MDSANIYRSDPEEAPAANERKSLLAHKRQNQEEEKAILRTLEQLQKQLEGIQGFRDTLNRRITDLLAIELRQATTMQQARREAPEGQPIFTKRLDSLRGIESIRANLRQIEKEIDELPTAIGRFLYGAIGYTFSSRQSLEARRVTVQRALEQMETATLEKEKLYESSGRHPQDLLNDLMQKPMRIDETNAENEGDAPVEETVMLEVVEQFDSGAWNKTVRIHLPSREGSERFDRFVILAIPSSRVAEFVRWLELRNPSVRPDWMGEGKLDVRNAFRGADFRDYGVHFPLRRLPDGSFALTGEFLSEFGELIASEDQG